MYLSLNAKANSSARINSTTFLNLSFQILIYVFNAIVFVEIRRQMSENMV